MNLRARKRINTRIAAAAAVCAWLGAGGPVAADTLALYSFEGPSLAPAAVHPNVSAANFGWSGDGTTNFPAGHGGGVAFSKTDWTPEAGPDDYFSFSLTVGAGYVATVTNVSFYNQRSGTGPTNWSVRYSRDGSSFYVLGADFSNTDIGTVAPDSADDRPAYDLTGTVYFRLYGTNAGSASGSWRVDDVVVIGDVRLDDGTRRVRHQGFDGSPEDNWGYVTNAATAAVGPSGDRAYAGYQSLRIAGSVANEDPNVAFANVSLAGISSPGFSIAFAADGPDSDDDLYLEVSYDGGSTWTGAGSTQLVDGFGNLDLGFGKVVAARVPPGANPYSFSLPSGATQVAARVTFNEKNDNSTADFYYIDSVLLSGTPLPDTNAPSIGNYGAASAITTTGATVPYHVQGGYPYPAVTVYWGPVDGTTNGSGWSHEALLGPQAWGTWTHTMTGLTPGQRYFYRFYAENSQGHAWSAGSSSFTTVPGSVVAGRRVFLDSFGIGTTPPLCIDRDTNGLADAWEEEYLGGMGQDPYADSDGDGISNRDEQIAGTDPSNTNSLMRLVSVDLDAPGTDDITILVAGGNNSGTTQFSAVGDKNKRQFVVRAADGATAAKSPVASIPDTGTGINTWTDTNMVNEASRRYYEVSVTYGGQGYTNAEEWAAYVQNRLDTETYMVSVPVDLRSSNNLNSTVGQQLARGLFAGSSTNNADRMYRLTTDGIWEYYYLLTNASGQAVWWDAQALADADLVITPGMGFWVERRTGTPRVRATCVFAGRSYTNAPPIAFRTNHNANGWAWTAFGWPFSVPATQVNSGIGSTPANQLGFAAMGTGGTTDRTIRPHEDKGDQIWVWDGRRYRDVYWLIDGGGANLDGRWWNDRTMSFADIELVPGEAYLYRQHVATNGAVTGTNFLWQPVKP